MLHTFLVINCFSYYALHLGYSEQILDGEALVSPFINLKFNAANNFNIILYTYIYY